MTEGILLATVDQVPKGEGRTFEVAGRRVAVFHTHSGEVFATQAECPHRAGPLADGLLGGTTVVCPLHDRTFDLRTGCGLSDNTRAIEVYPVEVSGEGEIRLVPADGRAPA
jgi:nitrite reductase (NADH) small subunit